MTTTPICRLVRTPPAPVVAPRLDGDQRVVVEHAGGPLLVLAGPGTGKTTTLVEAVVARVEKGLRPEQVLVLTFSRKAADELRERITTRLGRTMTEPAAYTFHSWCYGLLRAYDTPPDEAPLRLLSGAERDVRIRELLAGNAAGDGRTRWPEPLRAALTTRGFAREVADLLDRARERRLDGAALRDLGAVHGRSAWVSAGDFLDEYLDVLAAQGAIDYAGLVRRAIELLSRDDIGADVRGRYRATYVDEYQDTDPSQEELLAELAGRGGDLTVVGDPDQSIYAFRGADVSGILDFPTRFAAADGRPAPVVSLRTSRRAGAQLLAPSRALARRLPLAGLGGVVRAGHRDLDACGPEPAAAPEVRVYPSVADEVIGVTDLLRRAHLQDGVAWAQMAVLVRSGVRSIPVLRRAFAAAGVPVSVAADELPVARDPAVAPLLAALRLAAEGPEAVSVDVARLLLLSPLGRAQPTDLRALGRALRARERAAGVTYPRPSAILIREVLVDREELTDVPGAKLVRRIRRLVAAAREALREGGPQDALWALWEGSGWAHRLDAQSWRGGPAGRAADRDLDAVVALFEAAARLEQRQPRAGVATLLGELEAQEIPAAPEEERSVRTDAVRLLTAHRAKGLEWELVVVAGVQEGVWPDLRRRDSLLEADLVDHGGLRAVPTQQSLLVEERRLFYVALTRARARLVITAVHSLDDASDRPSRFLDEIGLPVAAPRDSSGEVLSPASLIARLRRAAADPETSAGRRDAAAGELARLASARAGNGTPLLPAADPGTWWGLRDVTPGAAPIRDPAALVTLSGSMVSSYDTCPLRWFLDREVRAGRPATVAQGFGKVVHALAQLVAEGSLPADSDALAGRLSAVWPSLGFQAPWQADQERTEARAALERLVRWLDAADRELVAGECDFDVAYDPAVRLRGRVDRLERDADGQIAIVDFKTGRNPAPKAELEYHPQLAVYQLALRAGGLAGVLGDTPPRLGGAELIWLRDGPAGGLPKVQRQEPLPPEVSWADELVRRTAAGIRAEHFPARPNDGCRCCPFRAACPAQDTGRQVIE